MKRSEISRPGLEAEVSARDVAALRRVCVLADREDEGLRRALAASESALAAATSRIAHLSLEPARLGALPASERSAREAAVSRVKPLTTQIKEKNACLTVLHAESPSLKHALSSPATRHQVLLPALVECLAPGIVAAAKAEAARPHPLAFQSLSGYTHGAFLSRVSQDSAPLVTGQEASMGFVVALEFALIDRAHLLFSPNSVTSLPASSSSTTTPQKATGALR